MDCSEDESQQPAPPSCQVCGGVMRMARLKGPGLFSNYSYIELEQMDNKEGKKDALESDKDRTLCLDAWVCTVCGHVDLHAHVHPSDDSSQN